MKPAGASSPDIAGNTVSPPLPVLQLVGVRKMFKDFAAVERIDLDIREGEFLTIVGPSGSGKTTLLRMLAGMESPSEGNITLRGRRINDVAPNERPTCLVFQSLALFPHMTVGRNIEFALKVRGLAPAERKRRALELMAMMRLPEGHYGRNVMQCSGGEKQRVALARAFAYDPDILFFDEPLSALDYKLKKALEKELKDLHKESGKTFVYITHSLEEAMVMSDRIGVMRAGRLVQVGTPEEIYTKPADRFVSEFVGEVNVLTATLGTDGAWTTPQSTAPLTLVLPERLKGSREVAIVVRPEFLRFVERPEEADNCMSGILYNEYSLGSRVQYQVRVGASVMLAEVSRGLGRTAAIDQPVLVGWDAKNAIVVEV
ncbi:MAG: ABC transporter ATP-binding protein [Rhizobiaceae bacterium]|nr:ABC transporter ATP-binding protein [Rhizobiaceae bacterium]